MKGKTTKRKIKWGKNNTKKANEEKTTKNREQTINNKKIMNEMTKK